MDLVPFEMLADTISPGKQIEDLLPAFEVKQALALGGGNLPTAQHSLA